MRMSSKTTAKKDPVYIICDICTKKIEQVDHRQVRCQSDEKGVKSPCQVIANDRTVAAFRQKKKDNNKTCLKCGKKFPSKGAYNRICDKCEIVNSRVARTMYKVSAC